MEKVRVLGLSGCSHCEALVTKLTEENIPFQLLDADAKENSNLADRMEDILQVNVYPLVIIEGSSNATYLHRVDSYEAAKASSVMYATKIGCVSTDMMVDQIKKHLK